MASSLTPDIVDDARDRAIEKCVGVLIPAIERQLRDDGTTYGDEPLSRGDRILRFQDWAQRGVLNTLRAVKPELYESVLRQYQRDIAESPIVTQREFDPMQPGAAR